MEKSCKNIEQMLVDYADDQLSQSDTNKVAEHLAKCTECRKILDALQKSLELANVIWADNLAETENIRIPAAKIRKIRWKRYLAMAASILLVATASVVWHIRTKPKVNELTFAEIERKISESGRAARLLAAAEMLSEDPEAKIILKQQYQYIVETYPETNSAIEAKSKMQ
jgi:predicted anti-sigma-YlaC factor YlaD